MRRALKGLVVVALSISTTYSDAHSNNLQQDIFVIDMDKVENETKIGKGIKDKVEKYMLSIKKQIEMLEKFSEMKDQDVNSKHISEDIDSYPPDFNLEQFKNATDKNKHLMLYSLAQKKSNKVNEVTRSVILKMQNFIKEKIKCVAQKRKASLILDKSALLYGESVVDITSEVIGEIDKNCQEFTFPKELSKF